MADFLRIANKSSYIAVIGALALVFALALSGCGGGSKEAEHPTGAKHRSADAAAIHPRYGPAKRRYLAHFNPDCSTASSQADAAGSQIQKLISQIGAGKVRAVHKLVRYLDALANAFEGTLREARGFGRPPNPDRAQALSYFSDAASVIHGIRRLTAAVAKIEPSGIQTAINEVTKFTDATQLAAERYGIPTCTNTHTSGSDLASGPAV